jgi:hypothetical protein
MDMIAECIPFLMVSRAALRIQIGYKMTEAHLDVKVGLSLW